MKQQYQQTAIYGKVNVSVINRTFPSFLSIPNDPENTDWQAYQAWLAQGNKPLPPEGAN